VICSILVLRQLGVGASEHAAPARKLAPRDPRLLAAEHPGAVALDGSRTERCEVGARLGLREALRPQLLRREDRPHVARPLLLGSEREDRRPEHVEPDDRRELGSAGGCQLLVDDDLLRRRAAAAAELRRPRAADEAGLVAARLPAAEERHPLVERVRDLGRGGRVLREERAHLLLQLTLGRLERELHCCLLIGA
jgi:hypothetical protein